MTPFGLKIRELREKKGVNQKQMARDLKVSAAYLSALEHGQRGKPSWEFTQRIIGYFNIIWDEAEELQMLAANSHTRIVVDTRKLSSQATDLANLLSSEIANLSDQDCEVISKEILKRC